MASYKALLDERAKLVAEAKTLFAKAETEARDLSTDEKSRDDDIAARLDIVAGELQRENRRRAWEQDVQVIPDNDTPRITGGHDRAADKPWGAITGYGFGEFLSAVRAAQTGRGLDPRLIYQAAAQGMGETIGADGGFAVPKAFADDIALRLHGGDILGLVKKRAMTVGNSLDLKIVDETSRATGSRHGAVQGYWVDEGTSINASKVKMGELNFKLRKVAALGYATDELLADAGLMESLIGDAFVDELKFLVEDSIINGTGVGQPLGILNATALVSVAKETNQVAATIVAENILNMWRRMYAPSRRTAVWLINQDIESQLSSMSLAVGTGGIPVYMPANGLSASPFDTLRGRPVIPVEYASTLGTKGDIILADLNQYWFFDKGEPQRATSLHVAFATDEMAFRVTYRVDGRPRWKTALTPFKGTATQSPFITLDTRA